MDGREDGEGRESEFGGREEIGLLVGESRLVEVGHLQKDGDVVREVLWRLEEGDCLLEVLERDEKERILVDVVCRILLDLFHPPPRTVDGKVEFYGIDNLQIFH